MRQLACSVSAADAAVDGAEALALWRPGRYAVVLADIHMPRMDGYELTAAIRAEEAELAGRARRSWRSPPTPWRRGGALPRSRHGALSCQAGDHGAAARHTAALDVPCAAGKRGEVRSGDRSRQSSHLDGRGRGGDQRTSGELRGQRPRGTARDRGGPCAQRPSDDWSLRDTELRGASLGVGARELAEIAARLQAAARGGARSECYVCFDALAVAIQRVAAEIGGELPLSA